ncbi:MAG TPA: CoA pyrophosphatase [Nitrosopumilaceae archaeon]|nr:CoA pyrophosphatase [Nitrosopumilaceae archaeon]
MEFSKLKTALSSKISPEISDDGKNKLASVMIVIYGTDPIIIMTEKPDTMNFHAGEISFPGGKFDQGDNDLLDTAIRETKEEIGLEILRNKVIGQLKPVTTLNSKFKIIPFVSILDSVPKLRANHEVKTILNIPLIPFLKTLTDDPDPNHKSIQEMYTFTFENKIVWGASARMLKQIVDLMSNQNLI